MTILTTLIIDRDTCSMILDASELTRERVRPCIDAIARRIEQALEEAGVEVVEVVREYQSTGLHSTADIDPRLIERVLVGDVDAIRAEVLFADCDADALVRAVEADEPVEGEDSEEDVPGSVEADVADE